MVEPGGLTSTHVLNERRARPIHGVMAPQVSDDQHPGARLYTREDESVRVEAHEDGGVWAVSIVGPGGEDRVRVFHEQAAFEAFCIDHDRALLSKGFRPRANVERRSDESEPLLADSYPPGRRRG